METYEIAIYAGDGIGLEVTPEAMKVVEAAAEVCGFGIKTREYDWGHRYWKKTGQVAPPDFLDKLRDSDVVFLGAVGDPEVLPDHVTLLPLVQIRQGFQQYVCLRPCKLLPTVVSPLSDKKFGDIDIMIVRENSEGEYFNCGASFQPGEPAEFSLQTAVHSRVGVERIVRYAFEMALKRRRRVTLATKSNALRYGMVMWDRIYEEIAKEYPQVEANKCHVDALCMYFVQKPEMYDVVVGSNLFADILSDLGGGITGSLGLSPSCSLNPERKFPSMFEPVHGSAPDIAGKRIANPLAAIRSAAMMLDFLGQTQAAVLVEEAVVENLKAGVVRTPDLGGKARTEEVGDDVVSRILRAK